ncbi:MAG: polyprenyl synthetase family protein [Betaproteobacteria bacterium]
MQSRQARIEEVLERTLPAIDIAPERLHEAMRYAVLGGGKRIRPLLIYAGGEASDAPIEAADRIAAAVELIHVYSLVHDDLPAMDDDVLRRGKPTVHVQFDEATALLVGDSLHSLAFEVLAADAVTDGPIRIDMIARLAAAAGSRGMAGGQAVDLASLGKNLTLPELEFMHVHKTGALIRASVLLGAQCGTEVSDEAMVALDHFAKCIGLAFQVVDDVLDATASTATLGKTAGKDADSNKPTYVSVLGVEAARRFAAGLLDDAVASLQKLDGRCERLAQLGRFIVTREF